MVKVKVGDIFESSAKTLVNTVNTVGVMGKGIALEFKERYPSMYKEYASLCKANLVKAGEPYYYHDLSGNSIINFPTKEHWRSPSKLSYITNGLDWFVRNYEQLGITSIAFPPLGCGNGGLKWEIVGPIMYDKLSKLPLEIEIYAPHGTSPKKLTEKYLKENLIKDTSEILGGKGLKFNDKWLLVIYTSNQINQNEYSLKVGRTIFQKICYVLSLEKVDLGLTFKQNSYGPYSAEIQEMITSLSNANLIVEKRLGRMIELSATDKFDINLNQYSQSEMSAVRRTVDLFSRVQNTDQAELISTILFSYSEVSQENKKPVPIKLVYEHIIQWKPKWKNIRDEELYSNMINLAMLGWLNISLPIKHLDKLEAIVFN